ncbi:MAG: glycolate oxidase subunit GlcF [Gammaproteobacteria bacterium]|nr:glycolate oxidase subunit GlcF [Gammaproteobacteria bacterium]
MQTRLLAALLVTEEGREADAILRQCVHCGFCTAVCPTYRLLGDELDGPRGRIYLIKQVLEGQPPTRRTQTHLDRCLTCLACEPACPSGVRYRRLVDLGRREIARQVERPIRERWLRRVLLLVLPRRRLFSAALAIGRLLRPILPAALRRHIPVDDPRTPAPPTQNATPAANAQRTSATRRVLLLRGCVQPALAPAIDRATTDVLRALGIETVIAAEAGCCGAIELHLDATQAALERARRNIDAWWPLLEAGAEAIVVNASGCGVMVKDYGDLLRHDPRYAARAARVAALARDPIELLAGEDLDAFRLAVPRTIAFHAPCSLQHGQRLHGTVEALLGRLGYTLTKVADAGLCCGSAGTYSLLQSELSRRLLRDKVARLEAGAPELIATANIGCLLQLRGAAARPVVHWLELLWRER